MKETVRIVLNGDLTGLRKEWESSSEWPFGSYGVAKFPSTAVELVELRALLPKFPEVTCTEFVERSYSSRELQSFSAFVLWINGRVDLGQAQGLVIGSNCLGCGFPESRRRVQPLYLDAKHIPKTDLAMTDDWEVVVSGRVAQVFESSGLTGFTLWPVLVEGKVSDYRVLSIEAQIDAKLADTLRYSGTQCSVCGRFDKFYPVHPSKELSIPIDLLPRCDLAYLNPKFERSHNHFKLLSLRAYSLLVQLKATGYWVQPVHTHFK